jgi:hypothetical protein
MNNLILWGKEFGWFANEVDYSQELDFCGLATYLLITCYYNRRKRVTEWIVNVYNNRS